MLGSSGCSGYRRTRKRKRRRGLCRGCLVGSSEAPTRCPTAFVWYFINTSANYFPFFVRPGRFRSRIGNAPYKSASPGLRIPPACGYRILLALVCMRDASVEYHLYTLPIVDFDSTSDSCNELARSDRCRDWNPG